MFSKLRRRTANNPSAPLAHLLTSNNPPSDAEDTLARNTIQTMRDSLTVLQLDIDGYLSDDSNPRSAATNLERHKATIIKSLTAHESIISPLRKLPPELLQLIFQKAYWDPTFTLPWSLSQVCLAWRTIVQSTPILWSRISIDFNTKSTRLRSQEARLKLILQRSSNVDLRVSIRGSIGQGDKRLSLLLILMAHSERWGYLNLELVTKTIMSLQAVKGHLPRLSQLHLKSSRPERQMTIDMFSVAPRLETVVFDNVNDLNSRYIRIPVIVPFHQLSSYVRKIVPYSRGELKTSLADFSNLVHFETSWECTVGQLEPRITFPRLKILVIFFCDGNIHPSGGFFERLILPCIREIIVRGQADGVTLAISSMISQRLPCNLRILSITTLENPSDLRSLLLLTPRLKDLRIRLSSRLDLVNLLATSERPPLLPKLHSLCVVLPAQFIPSFSSPLATFIATRVEMPNARAGFCIETLQLSFLTEFACRAAYFAVQPFPQVGELDSNVLALVNSWKKRLVEEIPHLSHNPTPQTMLINRLMHWRRLHQLFNAIEGYDIPTSGYLHVSKLHFVMYAVDHTEPSLIPGNKRYHFCSRAKALLARWKPILLQDVHYYQWLNTDPMTLTYVPKRADLRKSSSAIDFIYSRAKMFEFYR